MTRTRGCRQHSSIHLIALTATAVALFLTGCSHARVGWDTVDLDAGFGIQAPMLGVAFDPHIRLRLGVREEGRNVKDFDSLTGDELLVLAKLRVMADSRATGDLENQHR